MNANAPHGLGELDRRVILNSLKADGVAQTRAEDLMWWIESHWLPLAQPTAKIEVSASRRHFGKIEAAARELLKLLKKDVPLVNTMRLVDVIRTPLVNARSTTEQLEDLEESWAALSEALSIVADAARSEVTGVLPGERTKPTAPALLKWRDDLVSMVRDAYVDVVKLRGGKAKLLRMTTKILTAVGVEADEREIRRVLKRAPKAPVEIRPLE